MGADTSEDEVDTADENTNLSILSSGDEDLILCMTELQEVVGAVEDDQKGLMETEKDVAKKKRSTEVQSNLLSWMKEKRVQKSKCGSASREVEKKSEGKQTRITSWITRY